MIEVDTLKLLPHPTNKNMFTILRGDYKATVIEITDIKLEDNSLVFNLTVYEKRPCCGCFSICRP